MDLVFLDAGPLSQLANPKDTPLAIRVRQWVKDLTAAGVLVCIPEIADYEVRRELVRAGKAPGIARLDQVKAQLEFAPITSEAMLKAADLWAAARNAGIQTAPDEALDGDCILAAQALVAAWPGDRVTVATSNVGHLARFVDARTFDKITPHIRPIGPSPGPPP